MSLAMVAYLYLHNLSASSRFASLISLRQDLRQGSVKQATPRQSLVAQPTQWPAV